MCWVRQARPDVVIATTSETCLVKWLEKEKMKVPRDIGLVVFNRKNDKTSISGIDQMVEQQGVAVVDLLLSQMRAGECGIPETPKELLLDGNWVGGATTRRKK